MPRPSVIAHRGASGYLPEHTQEAKAAAHAMGADYIEQDIIASRDGVLLVLHDIYLDDVTDVADRFPNRAREDGHFYAIDFDFSELETLRVHERTRSVSSTDARDPSEGRAQAWPSRFPAASGNFRIASLEQELELIAGLNHATGREAGIYPEIKDPAWHVSNGIDITHLVVTTLENHGYLDPAARDAEPRVYLQCFDAEELQRIRADIDPPIPLVQLLTSEDDASSEALAEIAAYAQGIGPAYFSLIRQTENGMVPNALCADAQRQGLVVHPYTFRRDQLPSFSADFRDLIRLFAGDVGVDGLFTDFPDDAISILSEMDLD